MNFIDRVNKCWDEIAETETVKAMQAKNINGATGGKAEAKTVDDVMKSFIDNL